ncbi:MAG: hypothetical protein EXX96DRAFT_582697 [Benjaminiella poitrasii]|nr:MAG: hypothetical protein EXX96DRAFT_582697 [Benjaminiella poitrasii]
MPSLSPERLNEMINMIHTLAEQNAAMAVRLRQRAVTFNENRNRRSSVRNGIIIHPSTIIASNSPSFSTNNENDPSSGDTDHQLATSQDVPAFFSPVYSHIHYQFPAQTSSPRYTRDYSQDLQSFIDNVDTNEEDDDDDMDNTIIDYRDRRVSGMVQAAEDCHMDTIQTQRYIEHWFPGSAVDSIHNPHRNFCRENKALQFTLDYLIKPSTFFLYS